MLSTTGLSPVAQLFSGTSGPSPVELAPVAPEWPITPIASNSAVRWMDGSDDVVPLEAAVSAAEPQPATARHSASVIVEPRNRCMAAPLRSGCPREAGAHPTAAGLRAHRPRPRPRHVRHGQRRAPANP